MNGYELRVTSYEFVIAAIYTISELKIENPRPETDKFRTSGRRIKIETVNVGKLHASTRNS
jgi:hypothetical protein